MDQVHVDARGGQGQGRGLPVASSCCSSRRLLLLAPPPPPRPRPRPRLGLARRGVRGGQRRRGLVESVAGPGEDGEGDDGAAVGERGEEVEEGGLV